MEHVESVVFNARGQVREGKMQVLRHVFKSTSTSESTIYLMWWTCLFTTKRHGSTNPYLGWANKGCGHGNTESFNGKIICFNVSSGRGLKFHPPTNNTNGPNKSRNNNIQTFNIFHCPRD